MSERIAVIDLGTNTFHLLIAEISANGLSVLQKERIAVKIGQGGINKGVITDDAQDRALNALIEFKRQIDNFQIKDVYATATSAIRSAKNGKTLTQKIKDATGIQVTVISGDQEAQYIYEAVKKAVDIGSEISLIMDIGGGSVEFIICNQETIFWKESFEIGAQRLLDLFHYHDPIIPEEIENLNMFLTDHLNNLIRANLEYNPTVLIGSSGSFDTFSDIYKFAYGVVATEESTEVPLSLESFYGIYEDLITKKREERLEIPGMIEMRVDMIVVAAILVNFVLESCHLNQIRVSAFSLKEGVLYHILNNINK